MSAAVTDLLGVEDVCRMAGIQKHSLYRMIRLGRFPRGAKLGKVQKWFPDQVETAVRNLAKQANKANPR